MASYKAFVWVVCFILFVELVSSHYISPEAMQVSNVTEPHGRSLRGRHRHHHRHNRHHKHKRSTIPVLTGCKVNFDAVNFMPLRRHCRSPYRRGTCCPAFKLVACRFTDQINDLSSTCAYDMFEHINKFYPAGWFYQNCAEGPKGLDCLQL